jgi:hypothetical protein
MGSRLRVVALDRGSDARINREAKVGFDCGNENLRNRFSGYVERRSHGATIELNEKAG